MNSIIFVGISCLYRIIINNLTLSRLATSYVTIDECKELFHLNNHIGDVCPVILMTQYQTRVKFIVMSSNQFWANI